MYRGQIIGGNILRAFEGVEAAAAQLQATTVPYEDYINPPSQCRTDM